MRRPQHWAMALLLLGAFSRVGSAQRGAPLLKTDLIELLSSPVIHSAEIAALVRRNCVAFRPSERDLTDLRNLGASADVVASIAGCTTGRAAPAPASGRPATPAPRLTATSLAPAPVAPAPLAPAAAPLQLVVVRQPRIVAAAGSQERVVVLAARSGIPQAGAEIVLVGSGSVDGSGRDMKVVTDDSGFAIFPLPVGRRIATYRLFVAPANAGAGTPAGRPTVELVVRPGPPASVVVTPREILFDQGLDSVVPIAVAVGDSVGNPVPGERVVLGGNAAAAGFRPDTAQTDSLGRARLVATWGGVRRGGTLQVKVGGRPMASVEVAVGAPLLEAGTGFLPPPSLRGVVRSGLEEPLVFEARTKLGHPAVGREVSFRAVNATVAQATATTDAEGRARVDVTLGDRVGPAVILATIDSVERLVTLQVAPGPPVELILEHDGSRVDGGELIVGLGTTFIIRVRPRDAYGNTSGVASLARTLREAPIGARLLLARLVSIEEEPSAVALTFKALRTGRANFKLRTSDIGTSVWLEVAQPR